MPMIYRMPRIPKGLGVGASIDRDHPVDGAPLRRADQVLVGDLDGMQHRLDLAAPVMEEAVELGKRGREIVLLHHERLQQAGVVRQVIVDLHGREAVAVELLGEIPVVLQRISSFRTNRDEEDCCTAMVPIK